MTRLLPAALLRCLCFALVLLADHAMASVIYRMTGATCTDSDHSYQYFPDYVNRDGSIGIEGAGPKLCNNHVAVEVRMRDGYVPGTEFNYLWGDSDELPPVESFSYNDGARSLYIPFGSNPPLTSMEGWLPANIEPSVFEVNTNGWGFFARTNGTWYFGLEAASGPCDLGSIEGPGGCQMGRWAYESVGTYKGWNRVPEPATTTLLLTSLGLMGFMARRRKQHSETAST